MSAAAQQKIDAVQTGAESWSAEDVVRRGLAEFHPQAAIVSSFGAVDVALIDIVARGTLVRLREEKMRPARAGVRVEAGNCCLEAGTSGGAGFSLWGFVLAATKTHRLKPAPLDAEVRTKS